MKFNDLLDGDTLEAVPIEQFAGAFDDGFPDCRTMTRGIRHGRLLVRGAEVCLDGGYPARKRLS
jgi:hypothetical protein